MVFEFNSGTCTLNRTTIQQKWARTSEIPFHFVPLLRKKKQVEAHTQKKTIIQFYGIDS